MELAAKEKHVATIEAELAAQEARVEPEMSPGSQDSFEQVTKLREKLLKEKNKLSAFHKKLEKEEAEAKEAQRNSEVEKREALEAEKKSISEKEEAATARAEAQKEKIEAAAARESAGAEKAKASEAMADAHAKQMTASAARAVAAAEKKEAQTARENAEKKVHDAEIATKEAIDATTAITELSWVQGRTMAYTPLMENDMIYLLIFAPAKVKNDLDIQALKKKSHKLPKPLLRKMDNRLLAL